MRVRLLIVSRIVALIAVLTTAIVVPSSTPANADGVAPAGFIIDGRGNGHGRGMSQYGSLGWALYQGKTWRQILNFYYRNGVNTLSRLSPSDDFVLPWGLMSVRLFEDYDATDKDRLQTAVVSDTGTLSVAGLNNPQTWSTIVVREKTGQTNVWEIWGSKIKK